MICFICGNKKGYCKHDNSELLKFRDELKEKRLRENCKHDWEEIDRIGCMYHVGLGCEDVMEMCKICGDSREYHSTKNAKMSLSEWIE